MTADFIQIESLAILSAVGIGICIWGIWKIVEILAEEYEKGADRMTNELFERELQNTSINDVSLADYIKENYVPMDVLDKIRAEIEQEYDNQGDWSFNDGLAFALDIIDRYK